LVIDIVRTDRDTFFKNRRDAPVRAADELGAKIASLGEPVRPDRVLPPVVPRAKPKAPDRSDGSGGRKPQKRVIVLDPGHGGVDPGAIGRHGASEKTVVFQFAQELRKRLRKSGKYVVLMTRSKDTFVRLRDRVHFARENEADLFIAVHADSLKRGDARGATVYTLSDNASDKEAGELATKENRADIIAGVDLGGETDEVTGILIDLAQRETNNQSVYFAKTLVKTMDRVTRMTSRPHRSAGFRVLKAPDVPSILLELGYLSSKSDEQMLQTSSWRVKAADAVADAIDEYFSARVARGQ
jgi:N-acetylmuramoyl-L-alanine amidase